MAVKLIYSDIALGAADNASVTVTDAETFAAPALLPFGVNTGAVATCEGNAWGLTKDYKVKGAQNFALWSRSRSDKTGVFAEYPLLTFEFTEQYTATGLTFHFSPDAGEYCSEIFVAWYQNGEIKESGYFYPNSGLYALENAVEAFDKIAIAFIKTNLPERRLKLERLTIGIIREFTGRELTGASFVNEIDLISSTIPVNVLDASFHSVGGAEFIFQRKQPVEAFNDNDLLGVYYIEKGERTSERNYKITCQDAIGVLELDTYAGGVWLTDTPVLTIVNDVVGGAFEIELDEALTNATLRGYIPTGTKRAALQHIAFALGACVDTAGTSKISLFLPLSEGGAEIPPTETYTGGKITMSDIVTNVSVMSYKFYAEKQNDKQSTIEINGTEYFYDETPYTAENPNVSAGTLPNVIEFAGCYLINENNAQRIADNILAYYMRREKYSAKHIISGQHTGGRATVHLPWDDIKSGNVIKMTISVSGITASDTEFLLD